MQHAKNRSLREEVYRAYITRASNGDLDNTAIINQILELRLEKAKLLGYNNYAEVWYLMYLELRYIYWAQGYYVVKWVNLFFPKKVSMEMKMATVEKAEELLEKLRSASWNPALKGIVVFPVVSSNIS